MKGISIKKSNNFTPVAILIVILFVSMIISLRIGWVDVSFANICKIILSAFGKEVLDISETTKSIILSVRLPRIILDVSVGMALSVSGCAMQGLFRNPMASPFITGIASGGAFGAALVILMGISSLWLGPFAFFFSLLTAFFVYYLAKTKTQLPVETLLLSGVALSFLFSALVAFMQYWSNERELREIVLWLMGRLWEADWEKVLISFPVILIGTIFLLFLHKELNILIIGDRTALSLGVELERVRKIILALVSLITGIAVSVSGVIGFVGLIVPHVMRMIIGPDHKKLLPCSALAGAIFIIITDTIARTVMSPVELPVGIITSICGVPFFLFILKSKRKLLGFSYGSQG